MLVITTIRHLLECLDRIFIGIINGDHLNIQTSTIGIASSCKGIPNLRNTPLYVILVLSSRRFISRVNTSTYISFSFCRHFCAGAATNGEATYSRRASNVRPLKCHIFIKIVLVIRDVINLYSFSNMHWYIRSRLLEFRRRVDVSNSLWIDVACQRICECKYWLYWWECWSKTRLDCPAICIILCLSPCHCWLLEIWYCKMQSDV